jgi:hypothetical protein
MQLLPLLPTGITFIDRTTVATGCAQRREQLYHKLDSAPFYTDGNSWNAMVWSGMKRMKRLPGLSAGCKNGRGIGWYRFSSFWLSYVWSIFMCIVSWNTTFTSTVYMVSNLEDTSSCVSLKANIQTLCFILITFRNMRSEATRSAGLTEFFAHLWPLSLIFQQL